MPNIPTIPNPTLAGQQPTGAPASAPAPAAAPQQPAPTAQAPAAPPAPPATNHTGSGSLFRKILSIGLMALAGGMAAEGQSGPGPAAAAGMATGIKLKQQQFENQQKATQTAQEQQRIGIEQQQANTAQGELGVEQGRLTLGQNQLAEQTRLDQANMALSHVKLLQANREIALLPANRQQQIEQTIGLPFAQNLVRSGAHVYGGSYDNYTDAYTQALRVQRQSKNMAVFAAPLIGSEDRDGNLKYGVYELPSGTLQTPMDLNIDGKTITVPAGTPRSQVGSILAESLARSIAGQYQLGVAGIRAQSAANVQSLRNLSPAELAQSYKTASGLVTSLNKQISDAQQQLSSLGSLVSPERDQINQTISDLQNQLAAAQQQQYAAYYYMSNKPEKGGPSPAPKVGDIVTVRGQRVKVTKVNADGTYEGVPAGGH